jgi:plastocyanin
VEIEFLNEDAGTYHNVAVYSGSAEGEPIFNGAGFPGHGERKYEFTAPAAGTYLFICDFHPTQMKGNLVVQEI